MDEDEVEDVEIDGVIFSYGHGPESARYWHIFVNARPYYTGLLNSSTAAELARFFTQIRDRLEAEGL